MLLQLAYVSATWPKLGAEEIERLLVKSRLKNQRLGITGLLLYKDGNVLQLLEGEPDAVERLFETIRVDPRHRQVLEMYRKPVERRDFADWTMGFQQLGTSHLRQLDGFSDVLSPAFDLSTIKSSRAMALLQAFRQTVR